MKVSIQQDISSIPAHHAARTLGPKVIGENPSGWTILGEVRDDHYSWVNYFEASHPTLGWVRGDYEDVVEAKSKKAYDHFTKHHPPSEWDYWDI